MNDDYDNDGLALDEEDQEALPHHGPEPTSVEAAIAILPVSGKLRRMVYEYLLTCGPNGATDDEIQVAINMPSHTQCLRRLELVGKGKVFKTPMVRKTRAGRNAIVWVADAHWTAPSTTSTL